MAKGLDRHNERKEEVLRFGKDLARRSKSTCELCETSGVKLNIYEVPPVEETPNFDMCIFICDDCIKKIENLFKVKENELRFLGNKVWSEVPLVQAVAVYSLTQVEEKYLWVEGIVENVYLEEKAKEFLEKIEL